ncbi:hypothetical protein CYMTET_31369 [Cymbomonas tetramitiformis]|uniref:Uncharacterized protein n=1 Tax=Cymbomonas tetramitiformis TaxID=36881 RepID=A0AAE0FI08_9CHLO|nr:hypothetical protein CYMTET_31369 [Cymbomonas tetramitiformis]
MYSSKLQKTVAVSTADGELVALSETARDIKHVLSDGLECANQCGAPHFVCHECLEGYTTQEANDRPERVCCPFAKLKDGSCNSVPYTDAELAHMLSQDAFDRYFAHRLKHKEAQLATEFEKENEKRVSAQPALAIAALDDGGHLLDGA